MAEITNIKEEALFWALANNIPAEVVAEMPLPVYRRFREYYLKNEYIRMAYVIGSLLKDMKKKSPQAGHKTKRRRR